MGAAVDSAAHAALVPLAAFPTPGVRAWQTGLLRPDRLEHASLSFTLTAALILATRDHAAAAAGALAFGLGKELWDARGSSGFDVIDLSADGAGVTLALIAVRARGH